VSPPPHRPTTYKDAVLSTMGGSLCTESLVVAPLSRPSTTVDGQLQMACRRSRPRCCVGRRHGPRAPNPQEHLLRGRQHRPRALLRMDGLKRTWGILLLPVLLEALGGFVCFLFFWRHFLGDNFLGGRLPSFCLPFFWFFWLIVTWCIVLLLHPLPSVLLGLFVHLPFMATPRIVGGC
jgi:hypothetical protein